MKLPLGAKIFGTIFILSGGWGLLMAVATGFSTVSTLPAYRVPDYLLTLLALVSLLTLIAGVGVLTATKWGYWMGITVVVARIILSISETVRRHQIIEIASHDRLIDQSAIQQSLQNLQLIEWVWPLCALSWYGLILWYFLRPGVKAQFIKTATRDK